MHIPHPVANTRRPFATQINSTISSLDALLGVPETPAQSELPARPATPTPPSIPLPKLPLPGTSSSPAQRKQAAGFAEVRQLARSHMHSHIDVPM